MNPNKIKWYLGTSSLSIMMEQERKHWLLKTDKVKELQDTVTGDVFRGQINNLGSDVIIETEKEYALDYVVRNGTFSAENVSDVFDLARSAFLYTPKLNGLHFARLKSINLDIEGNYHNFKLVLNNTNVIFVPMATDVNESSVMTCRWLMTKTNPILRMDDGQGGYIDQEIRFSTGVTNPTFYYPLEESIMPFQRVPNAFPSPDASISEFETITIVSDDAIGKPLFWFTCDESNIGPILNTSHLNSNLISPASMCLEIGHPGNVSDYKAKLYPACGVASGSAPNGLMNRWLIKCTPYNLLGTQYRFTNDVTDFDKPVMDIIFAKLNDSDEETGEVWHAQFTDSVGNNIITMTNNGLWEYVDEYTYKVRVDAFADNLYPEHNNIISAFDVALDETLSFVKTTTDTGYVGIQMGSSKNTSEQTPRYPHDITNLEGLPDWLNAENATPQHMSIYAIHNTPYYDPNDQNTRQIAGLIFDPGVERTYNSRFYPGQYRILSVDIVRRGSGYNMYPTGSSGNTNDRFFVRFNNGIISNTFFEVTRVDENGGVLEINPLYRDESDDVSGVFRGFYDSETNAFYYYPQFSGDPIPAYNRSYYIDQGTEKSYICLISDNVVTYQERNWHEASHNSGFEQTYDENTLTGNFLSTRWNTSKYSEEELIAVRDAWIADPEHNDGHMDDDVWWGTYTSCGGTGLVVSITIGYVEEVAEPITSDNIPTNQIGRVYVLSNDSPSYINNSKAKNPKPDRTIARICDIPTSVMQLSNIHGLAPTSVVDKKYIRSEASFTAEDQEYIYNGSKNRWVRPIHVDSNNNPITDHLDQGNDFVFDSMTLLNEVDLMGHNDFRKTMRLNQSVQPDHVHIYSIYKPGRGYSEGSMGIIVVGGYSFTYVVDRVNDVGGVLEASLASNDDPTTLINLANFNIIGSGITTPYGSSPLDSTAGTGLKVQLIIDNYDQLIPYKGAIFDDLYAFVRDDYGIWLAAYNTTRGEWQKLELVAQSNYSETTKTEGNVSLKDSYINSILPSIRSFTVQTSGADTYNMEVSLDAYQTASSINVIDDTRTPVSVPSASTTSELIDDRTVVDINQLYCNHINTITAAGRNEYAVIQAIKEKNDARFDSYIFWQWDDLNDTSNLMFTYGVIHRSLDNIQSTDGKTLLPKNELVIDNYVHTNAQTTIMWNVPHVGPMVWMFNPNSTTHEKYYVDAHTRELYVTRKQFSWKDIEIVYSDGDITKRLSLFNEDGTALKYNILTSNPSLVSADQSDIIYQQPDYQPLDPDSILNNNILPTGSWELVFPASTQSFKLKNVYDDESEYTPVKMNVIRGADIANTSDVLNSEGIPVNYKTLLVDEDTVTGRLSIRIYDQETGQWVTV